MLYAKHSHSHSTLLSFPSIHLLSIIIIMKIPDWKEGKEGKTFFIENFIWHMLSCYFAFIPLYMRFHIPNS